jgi:glycosyltransferase involved in cell wall biosynthesis
VVVCASDTEGTPNIIPEGMAKGRIPVSTKVGITDHLIFPGVNGCFIDRTVEDLTSVLKDLRDTPLVILQKMAVVNRSIALTQSWDVRIKTWDVVFRAAAAML